MKQKYDLTEIEDYFQSWESPEKAAAKINSVIVTLTSLYVNSADPCDGIYRLKESMEFLIGLRSAIEDVKSIAG